jgi:hypothetical protein
MKRKAKILVCSYALGLHLIYLEKCIQLVDKIISSLDVLMTTERQTTWTA